jgi:signal peptide peptidase SppA
LSDEALPKYQHIAASIFDTPWAITAPKLREISEFVQFAMRGGKFTAEEVLARVGQPSPGRVSRSQGAIAVLPLYGTITQRANLMSDFSGGTSTQMFATAFRQALADDTVKAIVIDTDSPGGSTDGVEELAAEIYRSRGTKPIVAQANTLMASAAYWIASAADEIIATPTAQVGSIGIITAHADESKALEQAGVKVTVMAAGKYKAEGNPTEPLSEEAMADTQARMGYFYNLFANAVARGRGVSQAQVVDGYGEGRVMTPDTALKAGMIDRIATLDDTLRRLGPQGGVRTPQSAESDRERFAAIAEIALTQEPVFAGAIHSGV